MKARMYGLHTLKEAEVTFYREVEAIKPGLHPLKEAEVTVSCEEETIRYGLPNMF